MFFIVVQINSVCGDGVNGLILAVHGGWNSFVPVGSVDAVGGEHNFRNDLQRERFVDEIACGTPER